MTGPSFKPHPLSQPTGSLLSGIQHHELLEQLRQNATDDWHKRESARARMRVLVKRILKKYGYPPDLAEDAVKLVLEQAEALLRQFG
ncbi:type I restriction enzyme endonuclease domain-containing protein [Devosia marina]|uniref:type I restriction enzyme endonuclease domain-containing protein n=1 Tax=Devosia marina TaxID=2683198 RepID=UPI0031B64A49